ncbi:MAG TPA: hypothetical protein EYP98_15205 [Planctomycetes bacterium]|nr:hypothetical protein [Planctomycetota bacterium]
MSSKPPKLASAYFLGFMFFLLAMLLWLRGMGKLLLPAALLALVGYGAHRIIKKIREPID